MAIADCFYVTLARDVWRNSSSCLQKRVKFQTGGAKMFLRKFYQIYRGKMLPSLVISFPISSMQLWKYLSRY